MPSLRANGDDSLIAIPSFPNRMVRQIAIYVTADGPVKRPPISPGAIGFRMGANGGRLRARMFAHYYGIDLRSIDWIQAGADEPGRVGKSRFEAAAGTGSRRSRTVRFPNAAAGEVDAVICAEPPRSTGDVIPRYAGCSKTVMPSKCLRSRTTGSIRSCTRSSSVKNSGTRAVGGGEPLHAFEEAKSRSSSGRSTTGASMAPIAWSSEYARVLKTVIGEDIFPYGIERNRSTLEAFLDYTFDRASAPAA